MNFQFNLGDRVVPITRMLGGWDGRVIGRAYRPVIKAHPSSPAAKGDEYLIQTTQPARIYSTQDLPSITRSFPDAPVDPTLIDFYTIAYGLELELVDPSLDYFKLAEDH